MGDPRFTMRIDRVAVSLAHDRAHVFQTHRNGSDEEVGALDIDSITDAKALHFALGLLIGKWEATP